MVEDLAWKCKGIIKAEYLITFSENKIAPPLTSKIVKNILVDAGEWFSKVLRSRAPYKPIFVSNLMYEVREGVWRPLYARPGKQVFVRAGTPYRFLVSACAEPEVVDTLLTLTGTFRPYGLEARVEPLSAEMKSLHTLGLGVEPGDSFKMTFFTPTIISVKHMAPPLSRGIRRVPNLYRLVPQPSTIFSYLMRLWNNIAEPKERIPNPAASDITAYAFGRASDLLLTEVDYRIRAETAIIGKNGTGNLRKTRGFTGWVIYKIHRKASKKYVTALRKLLELANNLGIGRSRGIGLGHTEIKKTASRIEP